MGSYLNPGNKGFRESLNSEIYIDKTGLIEKTNAVIDTRQKFLCVSRPRRFGKSMAADMLAAYYERERKILLCYLIHLRLVKQLLIRFIVISMMYSK